MVRLLQFSTVQSQQADHARYFALLWQACQYGGDPTKGTAGFSGRKALMQIRRIKQALRSVAIPTPDDVHAVTPTLAGGVCVLSEDDFGRVIEMMENTTWIADATDDSLAALEWLDAAPKKSQGDIAALVK